MSKRSPNRPIDGGFSLLELMIVVVMMALAAVMAAPALSRSTRQARRDEAIASVTARISEARQTAMRQRVPVEVEFDSGAQTLRVWADLNRNGLIDAGEQETFALPGGTPVTWTLPVDSGRFNAKGQFQTGSGYWRVAAKPDDGPDLYFYVFPSGQSFTTGEYH